ncbi:MAG: NfeD family protein [Hespellia sp.]|nr:NfeD family protein [Hespellia sp.]
MDTNVMVWLILFIVLVIIEALTVGLTTIWFAIGSLVACLLAWAGAGLPIQVIAFIVISVILFVVTRPIAMRYFNKDREKTNAESLVGKTALVLEQIDNLHAAGKVEVNGLEWTARTPEDHMKIDKDEIVTILGIEGVKLIVKRQEKTEVE